MKYAFFGTPDFAAQLLAGLIRRGLPPALVVTNPDRPAGRRQNLSAPPLKFFAEANGLPVLQPVKPADITPDLAGFDLFVVAAYGKVLPHSLLELPRRGTIGWHPSLLPKYRGPAPMQSAILDGAPETGVTLYLLGDGLDDGPILVQRVLPLGSQTNSELQLQCADLGAEMLAEAIPRFLRGEIKPLPQPPDGATYTRKFTSADGYVEPADLDSTLNGQVPEKVLAIWRKIRALNPEPGTWTIWRGQRVKLLRAILTDGSLRLTEIHRAGKAAQVPPRDFADGL